MCVCMCADMQVCGDTAWHVLRSGVDREGAALREEMVAALSRGLGDVVGEGGLLGVRTHNEPVLKELVRTWPTRTVRFLHEDQSGKGKPSPRRYDPTALRYEPRVPW